MESGNRPNWSEVTSAGIFRVPCEGGRFDRHFHDCEEYWLIFAGKAKVWTDRREWYVQRGDIVCTKAGDEHDVLEVYEDLEGFWFEGRTPPGGRVGHLHRAPDLADGHDVPAAVLPADFPASVV
jgi:mannose-6-phosphate isomerase-like protein (cupin superfamily)